MPNIKKTLEERTRSRQIWEIKHFLAQASALEIQEVYFFAKGAGARHQSARSISRAKTRTDRHAGRFCNWSGGTR